MPDLLNSLPDFITERDLPPEARMTRIQTGPEACIPAMLLREMPARQAGLSRRQPVYFPRP
jgi:hypothetical protein